jgi:hypothetical protein
VIKGAVTALQQFSPVSQFGPNLEKTPLGRIVVWIEADELWTGSRHTDARTKDEYPGLKGRVVNRSAIVEAQSAQTA